MATFFSAFSSFWREKQYEKVVLNYGFKMYTPQAKDAVGDRILCIHQDIAEEHESFPRMRHLISNVGK
jgi:3-phenylpropionate/cinnamic acid dioxygenase small subunit